MERKGDTVWDNVMRQGLTPWDWQYIGAVLANADDNQQLEFFKAFVKEMRGWGTRLQVEKQLAFVNMGLTPEERETLSMLGYEEQKT